MVTPYARGNHGQGWQAERRSVGTARGNSNDQNRKGKYMKTQSDSIKELATALAKFQAELPMAEKDSSGQVGGQSYNYASFESVLKAIEPRLSEFGLSFSQSQMDDPAYPDTVIIQNKIMHDSGEWLSGVGCMPVYAKKGLSMEQSRGLSTTYLKRYMLCSALGIGTEDCDAAGETVTQSPQGQPARQPQPEQPSNVLKCPDCGRPMRLRQSARGNFWGCTGYSSKGGPDSCSKIIDIKDAGRHPMWVDPAAPPQDQQDDPGPEQGDIPF